MFYNQSADNRKSFLKALMNALHSTMAIVIIGIIAIVIGSSCGSVRTHAGIEHEYSHNFDTGHYYGHGDGHCYRHDKHHKSTNTAKSIVMTMSATRSEPASAIR